MRKRFRTQIHLSNKNSAIEGTALNGVPSIAKKRLAIMPKKILGLSGISNVITSIARIVVTINLAVVIILIMVDVLLRNLFNSGVSGAVEISEYMLVIMAFLGIVQTNAGKGHLSVDLVVQGCSKKAKNIFALINNILIGIFFGFFFWAGLNRAISETSSVETAWFGSNVFMVWPIRYIVPISCAFIVIQAIFELSANRAE